MTEVIKRPPIGIGERATRFGRWQEIVPLWGHHVGTERLKAIERYFNSSELAREGWMTSYDLMNPGVREDTLKSDEREAQLFLEELERDYTTGAEIFGGAQQLIPYMAEFVLSKGLASLGSGVGKGIARRILAKTFLSKAGIANLPKYALRNIARAGAIKGAGLVGGAVTRYPMFIPRATALAHEQSFHSRLQLTDNGRFVLRDLEEGEWAKAVFRAHAETFVGVVAESTGEVIFNPAGRMLGRGLQRLPRVGPAVRRLTSALDKASKNKVVRWFRRGARAAEWHGLISEIGEERLEGLLIGALGLDPKETETNLFKRAMEGMTPDTWHDFIVELGVLAVPGVVGGTFTGLGMVRKRQKLASAYHKVHALLLPDQKPLTRSEMSSVVDQMEDYNKILDGEEDAGEAGPQARTIVSLMKSLTSAFNLTKEQSDAVQARILTMGAIHDVTNGNEGGTYVQNFIKAVERFETKDEALKWMAQQMGVSVEGLEKGLALGREDRGWLITTKNAEMTPEEHARWDVDRRAAAGEGAAIGIKEGRTPFRYTQAGEVELGGGFVAGGTPVETRAGARLAIKLAFAQGSRVSAALFKGVNELTEHPLTLPEGYVREGDYYVYKGEGAPVKEPGILSQEEEIQPRDEAEKALWNSLSFDPKKKDIDSLSPKDRLKVDVGRVSPGGGRDLSVVAQEAEAEKVVEEPVIDTTRNQLDEQVEEKARFLTLDEITTDDEVAVFVTPEGKIFSVPQEDRLSITHSGILSLLFPDTKSDDLPGMLLKKGYHRLRLGPKTSVFATETKSGLLWLRSILDRLNPEGRIDVLFGQRSSAVPTYLYSGSVANFADVALTPKRWKGPEAVAQEEGLRVKGLVGFLDDGSAILAALEGADFSTLMHEMFHIWKRGLSQEKMNALEKAFGVVDHNWSAVAYIGKTKTTKEELAARAFERWLWTGTTQNEELKPSMKLFSNWMQKIYKKIDGSSLDIDMNREIRNAMDNMFLIPEDSVEYVRTQVENDPLLLAQADEFGTGVIGEELDSPTRVKQFVALAKTWVKNIWDYSSGLEKTKGGRAALAGFSDMDAFLGLLEARFTRARDEAHKAMTGSDVRWLQEEEDGRTNQRRLIEPELESPEIPEERRARIEPWIEVGLQMQRELRKEAFLHRFMIKGQHGLVAPLQKEFEKGRLMRTYTQDGLRALIEENSKLGIALRQWIQRNNPEMDPVIINRELKKVHEGLTRKVVGALEHLRTIKDVPDVLTIDGGKVEILVTAPLLLYTKAMHDQCQRIAFVHVFGQGVLTTPSLGRLLELGKILKINPKKDKKRALLLLDEHGIDTSELLGQSLEQLHKRLTTEGIPFGINRAEIISRIFDLESLDFLTSAEVSRLKRSILKLKGVDLRLEGDDLLWAIKERAMEEVQDVASELRKQHGEEGGNVDVFDNIMALAQGLPMVRHRHLRGSKMWRTVRSVLSLVGMKHVALAAIPNITQLINLVPGYSGWGNFFRAVGDWFKNKSGIERELEELGAIRIRQMPKILEQKLTFGRLTRMLRDWLSRATFLNWNLRKNEVIAAQAGRYLADQWKKEGIHGGEVSKAEDLRLSPSDIAAVNSRKMTDLIYAKVVQNLAKITQYTTERQYRKGYIELSPFLRETFSYQSYSSGNMRQLFMMHKNIKDGIAEMKAGKIGGAAKALRGLKRVAATTVRYSISGMLISYLKQLFFATSPKDEEEEEGWLDAALDGLWKTQFLGPTTRMLWGGGFSDKDWEMGLVAMAPKVKAIGDMFRIGRNLTYKVVGSPERARGKLGQLPIFEQWTAYERRHFGAYRVFDNWVQYFMYPEKEDIDKLKSLSFKYKKDHNLLRGGGGGGQLDPHYAGVHYFMIRGDYENARYRAGLTYKAALKEGGTKELKKRITGLATSLRNRGPVVMTKDDYLRFLRSLPREKRIKYSKIQRLYLRRVKHLAPGG